MKNKKILLAIGAFFVLGIAFGVATKYYKNEQKRKIGFLAAANYKMFAPDYSPKKGEENPDVTVVEFLDPECESCRQFHPLMKSIMTEFEGKIQLVIRYATFHGNSALVIKILEASRKQDKYWETLDVLFHHQPEWGSHHDPRPDLIWQFLPKSGVDVEQIKKDMQDPKFDFIIEQDRKDGEALGIHGTPSFFVNGKQLEEFGFEQLRSAIAAELKK